MDIVLDYEPFCLLSLGLDRRFVLRLLSRVASFTAAGESAGVEVFVCGDRRMAGLNERFLGCPGPTNVLSFPDGRGGGQVAISWRAVSREAVLFRCPVLEHFIRLLTHGFLHLAGFEHSREMYDLTEQAVQAGLSTPGADELPGSFDRLAGGV
ncbi:MAG: rRNA maturation RNase YbeY [Desulfonatronovibrionaceae bacterium]